MANAAALNKLDNAKTMMAMKVALQGVKGIKVNVEPQPTLESRNRVTLTRRAARRPDRCG
jgi:hypothetical protein